MAGQVTVVFDKAALDKLMRSPSGPVMRRTAIFADKIKNQAVADARSDFPKRFIAERVVKRYGVDSRGAYYDVGTNRPTTAPHGIDGNPLLVFFWPKVGRVVAFPHVNHPGSNFTPYLRRALWEAVLKVRGQF